MSVDIRKRIGLYRLEIGAIETSDFQRRRFFGVIIKKSLQNWNH